MCLVTFYHHRGPAGKVGKVRRPNMEVLQTVKKKPSRTDRRLLSCRGTLSGDSGRFLEAKCHWRPKIYHFANSFPANLPSDLAIIVETRADLGKGETQPPSKSLGPNFPNRNIILSGSQGAFYI